MALPAVAVALAPVFKDSVCELASGLADGIRNVTSAQGSAFVNASEGAREIGFAIADRIRHGGPKLR